MQAIESIGYKVYFKDSLQELAAFIKNSNYSKVFFITDRNTAEFCLPVVQQQIPELNNFDIIEVDPGEENKNIDFCIGIWKMLLDFGADRKALVVNLGGGVVTDMGGFAASTYKRGVDFVQVPTTLLSQVDASVGGKTGIDIDNLKNVVGTFTQPQAVFIDPVFLKTLPERQLLSGFAEIIKHGLIYDKPYFEGLKTADYKAIDPKVIYRSVGIKNEVITVDPHEKGLRKILNFGHTIGHAIEGYSMLNDAEPLLHGEALAIGMICEAWLSQQTNGLSVTELDHITSYINSTFPAYRIKEETYDQLLELMKNDKKNENNQLLFSLLSSIGKCDYNCVASEELVINSLNYYNKSLA